MRLTICIAAAVVICGTSTAAAAKPTAFQINQTTWTYVDHGVKARESIDAKGNYIENAVSGKHIDHGTSVMKGDKVCFTSAMTKEGEMCWTTKPTKIGQSMVTTNDKGEKLKVTRVKYAPLKMPK
jgi:hypothetical protein